ncbi:hypothetical protein [Streptomyces sp. NBC_00091]|uniref:hypothetical protein n=1 Tax=Streptomyces sp. NBC_00091 TaxID=2975648 RepID=UPI002256B366|nr:hypothetical protein [Streptomyces sp. NBC_00091]MCX5378103.1 hypothetical protein [Streptomyces sp. NBC_00091]
MTERYEYVPHRLLRRRVRDIASGTEGELMAVINENVSDTATEHWMELAYIRGASGREFTTAATNIEPSQLSERASDQPQTTVGRRNERST